MRFSTTSIFRTLSGVCLLSAAIPLSSHASLVYFTNSVSFNSASTTSLVENFEATGVYPRDTPLPSLTHNGITYTGLAGVPSHNVWVASPGYPNFGTPTTTTSILTANGDEDILMSFLSPSTAVGFDTYLNTYGPATISVFGLGGITLGSYVLNQDPTHVGFWGVTSDADAITGIRFDSVHGGLINTGIDNIRMGSVVDSVPEPSSLILAALGAFAMFASLAKSRRKA